MDRLAKKIDQSSMEWATNSNVDRMDRTKNLALAYAYDHQKKERKAASQCKPCWYNTERIGGSAVTFQPCGLCGKEQSFCNTCTDVLCLECGLKEDLCVHCGADVELRLRRKLKQENLTKTAKDQ